MAKRGPHKSAVFEHFTMTVDGKHFLCQCKSDDATDTICNTKISAYTGTDNSNAPTRAANLKGHLQQVHSSIYETVQKKDIDDKPCPKQAKNEPHSSTTPTQSFFTSTKVLVSMTTEKFKRCIVSMVVKNNVPLTFFSQPPFMDLNGEMARKLGVCLERRSIRNFVIQRAAEEKQRLKALLCNKYLFLKMDAATRHRVNYFAINARYIDDDGKPRTDTLAVRDTQAQHTSEYLQKLVEDVITEFGIHEDQVLLIVTDNASNMVAMMERLNENRGNHQDDSDDEGNNSHEMDDQHDAKVDELDDMIDLIQFPFPTIQHMRCAVHTLQLAIRDGLKAKLRQVAIAARTPKVDAILKRRAGKGAVIDQATRWGSTYLMISRLLELKIYIQDLGNESLTLNEHQWEELLELEQLLKLPFLVTKKLQSEDLTPAIFFKEWKGLCFDLTKKGGVIADGTVHSMKRREAVLTSCTMLLAGIYVDPNTRLLLTPDQKEQAKQQIIQLARRKFCKESQSQPEPESTSTSNPAIQSRDGHDEFDHYLDQLDARHGQNQPEPQLRPAKHEIQMKKFKDGLKQLESINRSMKITFEDALALYSEDVAFIARLASTMPATQVSVERLFSFLRIVKSDFRASMKEDLAEAILFLRGRD